MKDPDILNALKDIDDPELGISIVDLGLIYRAERTHDAIAVDMTMTTPTCPIGEMLRQQAEAALRRRFADVGTVDVRLTFDPPWSPELVTDEGRRALEGFGPSSGRSR